MRIKGLTVASFAAMAMSLGVVATANATLINVDQNDNTARTGTMSYESGGDLVGSTIAFTYLNEPQGKSLVCDGRCQLHFSTGSNISEGSGGPGATYEFNGGGSFTLTGAVKDAATGQAVASGTLFSGSFGGTQKANRGNETAPNDFTFDGNGTGTLDPALIAYFNLDANSPFAFLNTEYDMGSATYDADGSVHGTVTNADLTISGTAAPVPEPSEFAMFALGLVLLGGGLYARRRSS